MSGDIGLVYIKIHSRNKVFFHKDGACCDSKVRVVQSHKERVRMNGGGCVCVCVWISNSPLSYNVLRNNMKRFFIIILMSK